jgi:HAD superfamily hydrolase (TIGR01509 family)
MRLGNIPVSQHLKINSNRALEVLNRRRAIRTLLFDWDGTLADSAQLGLAAFQKTFAELGVAFPHDIYEATYSPNWYSTYEALGLPREKWKLADDLWMKHYGEQTARLIEGAAETIAALHTPGNRLGVVSSGSEERIRREIERSELNAVFDVIICNEQIVNKKPHPEGLEIALRRLNSKPEESAYVGDSPEDIQMGKRANVFTIGVRGSYPSSARLLSSEPDIYLESITGLCRLFQCVRVQNRER